MGQCSITGIEIVNPDDTPFLGSITISADGRVLEVGTNQLSSSDSNVLFDGGNECWAFPGFIDIHTHGANGADLAEANDGVVTAIAEAKLKEGVTTFLPTTWTASPDHLREMVHQASAYKQLGEPFARTPFIHIEGPYINPKQAGAQNPEQIRIPDIDEIEQLQQLCPIGIVSLAIELDGALEFIAAMQSKKIVTSAAHSAASYSDYLSAKKAGLGHLTHYCNQMSPLHHREIGLVGAGLMDDQVYIELICDLQHLCPDMLQLIFNLKSCDQLMLITDSISASHLGDGEYQLGDTNVVVNDGTARIPAGNLAGSTLQFHQGVKNAHQVAEVSLDNLAKIASHNQARSLGLSDRGRLAPGYLADVTILNKQFEVVATIVGGDLRYQQ